MYKFLFIAHDGVMNAGPLKRAVNIEVICEDEESGREKARKIIDREYYLLESIEEINYEKRTI